MFRFLQHSVAVFFVLLLLSGVRFSSAHPAAVGPTLLSIPLTRPTPSIPLNESDYVHGSIVQQQHANRALKRFARMTGRLPPSEYELLLSIYNRILLLSAPRQRKYEIEKIEKVLAHLHDSAKHGPTGLDSNNSTGLTPDISRRHRSNAYTVPSPESSTFRNIGLSIDSNDYGYMVAVNMGSPPRTFNLLVDSGSADLWVGAEGCQSDKGGNCGNHKFLGAHSSRTFNRSDDSWAIGYVSGTVAGYLAQDDVSIAGLKLKGHRFGVAMNESDNFTPNDIPFDGLLGLGKEMISQQRIPTLLQSLFQARLIPAPVVSYKLPRLADGYNNGAMTLGGMDRKLYNPKTLVKKKNVNKFGYWGVNLDAVKVGKQDMHWSNRNIVMDTGTTLIIAPQNDVDAIHANIPGAHSDDNGWTVPCNMTTVISLTIGGQRFPIDPRDIAFYPVDDGSTECMSGIAVGGVGPFYLNNEWLVGDVFLKNVYFSTDDNLDQISIALPNK